MLQGTSHCSCLKYCFLLLEPLLTRWHDWTQQIGRFLPQKPVSSEIPNWSFVISPHFTKPKMLPEPVPASVYKNPQCDALTRRGTLHWSENKWVLLYNWVLTLVQLSQNLHNHSAIYRVDLWSAQPGLPAHNTTTTTTNTHTHTHTHRSTFSPFLDSMQILDVYWHVNNVEKTTFGIVVGLESIRVSDSSERSNGV